MNVGRSGVAEASDRKQIVLDTKPFDDDFPANSASQGRAHPRPDPELGRNPYLSQVPAASDILLCAKTMVDILATEEEVQPLDFCVDPDRMVARIMKDLGKTRE